MHDGHLYMALKNWSLSDATRANVLAVNLRDRVRRKLPTYDGSVAI
jgi:hypothetical protein